MTDIKISDLMSVIHYTIVKNCDENLVFIDQVRYFDKLIYDGDLEDFNVNDTELWKSIVNKIKSKKDIPPIHY